MGSHVFIPCCWLAPKTQVTTGQPFAEGLLGSYCKSVKPEFFSQLSLAEKLIVWSSGNLITNTYYPIYMSFEVSIGLWR